MNSVTSFRRDNGNCARGAIIICNGGTRDTVARCRIKLQAVDKPRGLTNATTNGRTEVEM